MLLQRLYIRVALGLVYLAGATSPAAAWAPATQVTIAREAARLSPPDLARQIDRHRRAFEEGVANAAGSGPLDRAAVDAVAAAVAAIRGHQPFEEIVRRLGTAAHWVAEANDPLASSGADPEAGRYAADYSRYVETAEPRFPLVFYGVQPELEAKRDLSPLIAAALRRGRELSPMIGLEYRRIGFASGIGQFDDRSSAFGAAALAFSHAVTDVTLALRYIWITAGGIDGRANLPARGTQLTVLPRSAP
jgi:hypothetical protein